MCRSLRICCALMTVVLMLGVARAADIVVAPGQLESALQNAMPGDSLLLQPGTHSGGLFRAGLIDVTIRSQDPADRAVIHGGVNNLQLSDATNVTIEQIIFDGGTGNGINIDDGGSFATPSSNITIRDITVQNVGTGGNNDGIKLSGVTGFLIDGVRVFNWGAGGSAIDPVGAHHGLIQNSLFRHTAGGATVSGVRPKGGSKQITIRANRFEITNGNGRAIQLGGSTGSQYFRFIDGDAGYEADRIVAEGNVIVGASSAANWVNIDGGVFHHNFIERPSRWTMRILNEIQGGAIVDTRNGEFHNNLVVFNDTSTEYSQAVNIGSETLSQTFSFSENQWYNLADPTVAGSTPQLPTTEVAGIYGVNPGDDAGVKAWEFDWGLWLVNANSSAGSFEPADPADYLLAHGSTGSEFLPLRANPFVGDWDFSPLGAGALTLEPFTQLALAYNVVPGGDSDGDGDVDGADFVAWQIGFGLAQNAKPSDGDFDGDGRVSALDFAVWTSNYRVANSPLAGWAVPEPATFWVALASLLLWQATIRKEK